ncbi:MAG: hypothetical protein QW412_00660 [Candidatus Aenigmatarchaeota archaeon]
MLTLRINFKAQVTEEFIYLLGVFCFFLLAFIIAYNWRNSQIQEQTLILELERVGDETANQVNLAYLSGSGFSKEYFLPERITGFLYNVTIYGNFIILNTTKSSYSTSLVTSSIEGNFTTGKNLIKNIDGRVKIN